MLDSSGATSFAGNTSNSIYVWGAQLELYEHFEEMWQDRLSFRYISTEGAPQGIKWTRFNIDYSPDTAIIQDQGVWALAFNLGRFQDGSVKDETDINIVYNQGLLRMTSYVDLDYFAEDYVGDSRVITY